MREISMRDASDARLLGRCLSRADGYEMGWTGAGVEVIFRGTCLWAQIERSERGEYEPWMMTQIDGAPVARYPLAKGCAWYPIVQNMASDQSRMIGIIKESQAMEAPVILRALRFDGELFAPQPRRYKLEFIGDSLTTGEGAVGPVGNGEWLTMWMSAHFNYTNYICEALNAERRVLSQSGWGVFCDWQGVRENALPAVYHRICAPCGQTQAYDFSAWQPDAVIVNLLTNDGNALQSAAGRGESAGTLRLQIIDAGVRFLRQIRQINPKAHIVWAYGMCGHQMLPVLRKIEDEYKKTGDERFDVVVLPKARADELGAHEHPGIKSHQKCADRLVRHLRAVL